MVAEFESSFHLILCWKLLESLKSFFKKIASGEEFNLIFDLGLSKRASSWPKPPATFFSLYYKFCWQKKAPSNKIVTHPRPSFEWHWTIIYSNRFILWNVRTMWCHGMPGTFWWICSQSRVYSDETTWCPWWKIPPENPWKCHFQDLIFKMSLDASVLKNLCLWSEFQSHLLFIISMVPKNCLTALNWPFLTLVKAARNFSTASASKDGSS